ncbi:transglutaminase-like domain-containing protein [Bradyrhizobium sp. Ash2021]|uniref:transglutaminase-like domain-containing protein n=1 Tax=Bradyrhizobium sp. Ash2021 TaxID=2954771 RepID=UPI002814DF12|nr:transglutaminase-like domain-containing protein [Bradyrhizobium sp. Ash2021]WMT79123.1 transglutaminase-like domain-containing protein [Bradyrhizobium sp. Ash2021]
MHRRDILVGGATIAIAASLSRAARSQAVFAPKPGPWRTFEVVSQLKIASQGSPAQAWVPLPSVNEVDWFRTFDNTWKSNGKATLETHPKYGASMVHVEWPTSEQSAAVEITSRFSTRDRAIDLSRSGKAAPLSASEQSLYTSPTKFIPTDGIARELSNKVVADAKATSDVEKARAIYDWIIDNTFRDARVRGCGAGDVAAMLMSGNLGGKCADLNALFVGLMRAQGIPARDVYGIRVAPSAFGYKSLGANTATISRAQHCRAEVHLAGFGWVPMDPADVRKVVLEEAPGGLAIDNDKVVAARKALFGSWEANWMAYNFAHDVELNGAKDGQVAFLMYPEAETGAGRLDCLDPDTFSYTITAKQIFA